MYIELYKYINDKVYKKFVCSILWQKNMGGGGVACIRVPIFFKLFYAYVILITV